MNGRVLLLSSRSALDSVRAALAEDEGLEIETITTLDDPRLGSDGVDCDAVLWDLDGWQDDEVATVRALLDRADPPEVIVVSGGAAEKVEAAVKEEALNYLHLPADPAQVRHLVAQALRRRQLEQENRRLRELVARVGEDEGIVSESAGMKRLLGLVQRVAGSSACVLIQGETGSGKGLIARTIHALGGRADEAFLNVNCGALQETLLESELFGHEKGAFTGATVAKPGLFEVAHGGTLLLDEIGEMSPAMQVKLLHVLDDGKVRRVGGTQYRKVDARVLAATNKTLKEEVREGKFREDLFFRLNVVQLTVPPLRERAEDVPGLVHRFLQRYRQPGQPAKTISRRALQILQHYHWPGNVRELANTIENMSLLAFGDKILPDDLPVHLQPGTIWESRAIEAPIPLSEMERLHIMRALEYTAGKKAPAARLLKIDVKTLSNKIKAYDIEL